MNVTGDSTDVTTYFKLRKTADGLEATGLTITDLDLQYVRSGVAPAAKVDATALADTDSAHADNKAIEIDATDQPGIYRVDWPDAAFASGVKEVILTVKHASCFTEDLRVAIDSPVNVTKLNGGAQSLLDLKDFADDGYDPSTNKVQGVVLVDTVATLTNLPSIPANWLTAAGIADDAFTAAKFADGFILAASFATGAIDAAAIADNAIDAGAIAANAITSAKIASNAIGASQIADNAITSAKLATDCITNAQIAATAVSEIQSGLATAAALTTAAGEVSTILATTNKLDDTLEDNAGTFRFTVASVGPVWSVAARTLTAATNITSTGGTTVPQTGDAYPIVNSGTHGNAAMKTLIDAAKLVVDAILADTGTDGVVVSDVTATKLAAIMLRLTAASIEAHASGEALNKDSLYGAMRQIQWSVIGDGNVLSIKKSDGTELGTRTLTATEGADPITGIS